VEGALRCKPGARCELVMTVSEGELAIRSKVVRCFVARLSPSSVRYRTAVAFDVARPLPDETPLLTGYELPDSPQRLGDGRVDTSRRGNSATHDRASALRDSVRSRE
jgi:hypothetical protein